MEGLAMSDLIKTSGLTASEKDRSKTPSVEAEEKVHENQPEITTTNAGIDQKARLLRPLRDHGKQRVQICFRITETAWHRLFELSRLFEMEPKDYAKAVLYRDLGVWTERIDYRKKRRSHLK